MSETSSGIIYGSKFELQTTESGRFSNGNGSDIKRLI